MLNNKNITSRIFYFCVILTWNYIYLEKAIESPFFQSKFVIENLWLYLLVTVPLLLHIIINNTFLWWITFLLLSCHNLTYFIMIINKIISKWPYPGNTHVKTYDSIPYRSLFFIACILLFEAILLKVKPFKSTSISKSK